MTSNEQNDPNPLVQCQKCYHVTREQSLVFTIIHPQTETTPAEYSTACNQENCSAYDDDIKTLLIDEICEICNDDIKFNDGDEIMDRCHDCYISGCEAQADAMNDR